MFDKDFYPTPENVIEEMLVGIDLTDKTIFEPSAGKGNIVDYVKQFAIKEVIACEIHPDLSKILATKCKIIKDDFLKVEAKDISHVDLIIMNPPFSADEVHILHAWEIAPEGCIILSLCNTQTLKNRFTRNRQQLYSLVENYGTKKDMLDCFRQSERPTGVDISMVSLTKPSTSYHQEFEGFFLEEDEELQSVGIMPYNSIRDLVNRYVEAVKTYDDLLQIGNKMNTLTSSFYGEKLAFSCTENEKPKLRNDYKKDLQKAGWKYIFGKMKLEKYSTTQLKSDINRFVETQQQIPFTMRNIYKMLEIVVGTTEQRMDKALLEVFDRLTERYYDNRYNLEGWKTNSHYLVNQKFILDWICYQDKWSKGSDKVQLSSRNLELIEDLTKALCFLTGTDYDNITSLYSFCHHNQCLYGQWYSYAFYEVKFFKKGTAHFKFQEEKVWAMFNQRIAKIKGYPLPESLKKY